MKFGDVADFLGRADQLYEAALFCSDRGLDEPLEVIRKSAPRSHPHLLSMTRVLKGDFRSESRLRKSFVRLEAGSILPPSHCSVHSGSFDLSASRSYGSSYWMGAYERFSSIGCSRMADAAKDLSLEGFACRTRLSRFPLIRAVAALSEKGALKHGGSFWLGPVASVALSDSAEMAIRACESELDGFPIFDHYFLVAPASEEKPPRRMDEGFFVLGERDGECHFVFSD